MIRRFPILLLPALAVPALTLAACGEEKQGADDRTAQGEILEGTISDGMVPLDTVTSQPPLMKEAPKATGSGAATEAASESAEDADSLDAQQPAVDSATAE